MPVPRKDEPPEKNILLTKHRLIQLLPSAA